MEPHVLAAATDYLEIWQLFVIVPLALAWVIGGGWWIGVSIRRQTEARRFHPGQGVVATLLATLAGGFGFGATLLICTTLEKLGGSSASTMTPLMTVGLTVGAAVGLLVVFTVFYAMFKASAVQVFKAMAPPTVVVLVLAGIAGGLMYSPIVTSAREKRNQEFCVKKLEGIRELLQFYAARNEMPPPTLKDLMSGVQGIDDPELYIQCPGKPKPDEKPSYIYVPYTSMQPVEDRLLLADGKDNHQSGVNVIIFSATLRNGRVVQNLQLQAMSHERFNELLVKPINESFAREYNK